MLGEEEAAPEALFLCCTLTEDTFLAAQGRREAQGVFGPPTPKPLWEEEMLPQGFH